MRPTLRALSVRHLNAFVVLADERNFTRAAKQCNLSQPAFSELVRSLEHELGARLFDRDTKRVALTSDGERFLPSARRLLEDFGHAVDDVRDHVERRRGRVAIAVLPALAAGWLPPVLAEFHRRYPGIGFDVADALSKDCIERVRSGRADFALASTRARSSDLVVELFCVDRFHLVCRRDHPLAKVKAPRLEDLASHPFVHLSRNSSVRQHIEQASFPLQMASVMELDQVSTVAGMVRAGLGVTVVPSLTLFHFEHADLVSRPLATPIERHIFIVHRKDRSLSSAARALLEHIEQHRPTEEPRRRRPRPQG